MSKIKSRAKLQVIEFIKTQKDTPFSFVLEDFSVDEAARFVHRMRVELSRLRAEALRRNRVPKPFKMQLISIEHLATDANPINAKVTLMKVDTLQTEVTEEIDQIMDNLAGGSIINA